MAETPAIPESQLNDLLVDYHARLKTEFSLEKLGEDADDPAKMADKVRKELLWHTGTFIAGIADLANNATSESVRFQACKFGIERVFGTGVVGDKEDGINRLINSLTGGEVGKSPHED